jgi:hypothetical protein
VRRWEGLPLLPPVESLLPQALLNVLCLGGVALMNVHPFTILGGLSTFAHVEPGRWVELAIDPPQARNLVSI